ncbi:TPA: DUF4252 domain-containing protein [Candidatus Poribacteria bacterium]|nr:DUF4252 domain-containing protein [Candidatus Poribacteria bacterium]
MKLVWTLEITIFISILGLALHIQPGALAKEKMPEEGIVEIDFPDATEAKVEVNITGTLFSLAAKAVQNEEDSALFNFLNGLKALHVRVYDTESLRGKQPKDIVKFYEQKLLKANWEVLARIKENGNMTGVYTLTQNDVIRGLFVVVSEERQDTGVGEEQKETVVVNLAGKVDLSKLSELNGIAGMDLKLPDLRAKREKISPIKEYRRKAIGYMVGEKWDEAIAQLEQILEIGDYLMSDYATLASIYLAKGDIGKCYYYLSRAYELEEDKETAVALRSKASSLAEKR